MEIADECMTELLRCHCVPDDDGLLGICDEGGIEVQHLADAGTAIAEAFAWLSARGLAELREDHQGEFIVLTPNA